MKSLFSCCIHGGGTCLAILSDLLDLINRSYAEFILICILFTMHDSLIQ